MKYHNKTVGYLKCYYWVFAAFLLALPQWVFARRSQSLGGIAKNLDQPIQGVIGLIQTICLIAGIGLLIGSVIKYMQHRKNPVEVTLGTVFTLLLVGLALIALTFIPLNR